jgi:Fe-Mn family superoxide dismutase
MFTLPKLTYKYTDLEPYIDAQTMEIHYSKHHAAYVDNLNSTLTPYPELLSQPINELLKNTSLLPNGVEQLVINNGGGHSNHTFFWEIMTPISKQTQISPLLLDAINSTFGNLDKFKEVFTAKAMSVFGSGWAFLIKKPDGSLSLKRHSFQNSPISQGNIPILGIDLWEHAYYLKYQNRKKDYISAWWNVVNWNQASINFESK